MPPSKKKPKINAGKNVHGATEEKSLEQTTEALVGLSNTASKEDVDKDLIDRRKTYVIHKANTLNVTTDFQDQLDVAEKTDYTEESKEVVDEKSGKKGPKPASLVQPANDQDAIPKKRGRKKKVVTEPSAAQTSEMTTEDQIKSDKPPKKRGRKKKSDSEAGTKATSGKGKTEAVDSPRSDNSTQQSEKQKDKEYDEADENTEATDLQKKPAKRGRKKKNP